MFYQNQLLIEGRLCQTPEVKTTKTGKKFSQFGICYNKPKKLSEPNEKGYMYDYIPNFFNMTAWGKSAENASKFQKGDPVTVSGTLSYETWTDDNGEKHYKTLILVNSIKKLDVEKRKAEIKETHQIAETDDDYVDMSAYDPSEKIPF